MAGRRIARSTVVACFAAAWGLNLMVAVGCSLAGLPSDWAIFSIMFLSGTLAGSMAAAVGSDTSSRPAISFLVLLALPGVRRHFLGETDALVLPSMLFGLVIGMVAMLRLPRLPEPEVEPVERWWDED